MSLWDRRKSPGAAGFRTLQGPAVASQSGDSPAGRQQRGLWA